jgi:exonuclease III
VLIRKLLSWNVKGFNEGDKRLRVRNLLGLWKAYVICLQESKLELISSSVVRIFVCGASFI